jgi:HD-GYP domain-containing protein (c-di-GMP phosphodiesterase class II)
MSSLFPRNRLVLAGASPGPAAQEAIWDVLERYALEMGRCDYTADQKPLALQAVRDSIGAEVVFWYPGSSGDAVEVVGASDLPAAWCRDFAEQCLSETPGLGGQLLRSVLPPGPAADPVRPHSAALVRVSKSRAIWIVALSLNARRTFGPTDVRIMGLIRQIPLNSRHRLEFNHRMSDTLAWLAQCVTTAIDAHVPHARGHSERVAKTAVQLGKRMNLGPAILSDLYFAGLLHDIGLTAVPQAVLLKPGQLTPEEFAQVREYPVIGDRILGEIRQLAHLRPAVRHHHERYDGRGYPDGLAGDGIPLLARILAVADGLDAMMSPRPHRPPLPANEIDEVLSAGAGRQWDPLVVEHCKACRRYLHARGATPLSAAPAVKEAVAAWIADSSQTASIRGRSRRSVSAPDGS